jgi:hypothetical protein
MWFEWTSLGEFKMGSKTIVAIVVVLIVMVAVFVLDTSLLNPILEKLSLHQPHDTYKAVFKCRRVISKK